MSAVVKSIRAKELAFQDKATVLSIDDDDVVVRYENGELQAKRAVSCLTEPEIGDEVLVACLPSGELYVLAVLERPDGTAVRVKARGDLTFQVAQGSFTVAAAKGVNILSSDDVQLTTSKGLKLRAVEGQVFFDKLTYLGRKVFAELEQAKTFVGALDTVADRIVQRVKRSYRFVEEADELRAEYIDYAAKKNLRFRARNTLITAKELFKTDAEQIHFG